MNNLISKFKRMFKCDSARIWRGGAHDLMFLIIGTNRSTKQSENSYWSDETGERIDFDYTQEHCIASGRTEGELIASAREYKKISKMSWPQYLEYQIKTKFTPKTVESVELKEKE